MFFLGGWGGGEFLLICSKSNLQLIVLTLNRCLLYERSNELCPGIFLLLLECSIQACQSWTCHWGGHIVGQQLFSICESKNGGKQSYGWLYGAQNVLSRKTYKRIQWAVKLIVIWLEDPQTTPELGEILAALPSETASTFGVVGSPAKLWRHSCK